MLQSEQPRPASRCQPAAAPQLLVHKLAGVEGARVSFAYRHWAGHASSAPRLLRYCVPDNQSMRAKCARNSVAHPWQVCHSVGSLQQALSTHHGAVVADLRVLRGDLLQLLHSLHCQLRADLEQELGRSHGEQRAFMGAQWGAHLYGHSLQMCSWAPRSRNVLNQHC